VVISVIDTGRWRPPPADPGTRGRGLSMITALSEHVEIHPSATTGTRMRPTSWKRGGISRSSGSARVAVVSRTTRERADRQPTWSHPELPAAVNCRHWGLATGTGPG
jgi:hypothetical protein